MKLQMIFAAGCLLCISHISGQSPKDISENTRYAQDVYAMHQPTALKVNAVDSEASFPGGRKALSAYLSENFRYPQKAAENGLEGMVLVKFTVRKDGKPVNPVITQSIHEIVDKEVIRLINAMPDWTPRQLNGQTVDVTVEIPFAISLR